MKWKIIPFLNDEELKDCDDFIKALLAKKKLKVGQSISSGGFQVEFDFEDEECYQFEVLQLRAIIEVKKEKKKKGKK